jgi:alpha/beta superfamily hydrolase
VQHFSEQETRFLWQGPASEIEMVTTLGDKQKHVSTTVIICHPHPLFGGAMGNKVVTTLARTFHDHGMATIRFNFRGVGKSTGAHDQGHGETDDVLAIAAWVKQERPQDTLWLAGFSFGGYVAANAASSLAVAQLITVAPQVSRFDDIDLSKILCPWLVIQGEADDVISPDAVYEWAEHQQPAPTLVRIPGAGHFFHGQLGDLRKVVEAALF